MTSQCRRVFKQMFLMQRVPAWSTSRLGRLIKTLKLQISVVQESQGRSLVSGADPPSH